MGEGEVGCGLEESSRCNPLAFSGTPRNVLLDGLAVAPVPPVLGLELERAVGEFCPGLLCFTELPAELCSPLGSISCLNALLCGVEVALLLVLNLELDRAAGDFCPGLLCFTDVTAFLSLSSMHHLLLQSPMPPVPPPP